MPTHQAPTIVLGAGGAGIIAAWRAASLGTRVTVLERNAKIGVKLRISGGGRCNITHGGPMEQILAAFRPREARFLKPAFYRWSNTDVLSLLERYGIATVERANGRIFPAHGFADDVVEALATAARNAGATFHTQCAVESVTVLPHGGFQVITKSDTYQARRVIIATGGISYAKTGTTGDGIRWAHELGHTIVPLLPALAPIAVEPRHPAEWRGVALRDGRLSVWSNEKKIFSWDDDLLFSHEGLTGPAALEVSRTAAEAMGNSVVSLSFDFFPSNEFELLDQELHTTILAQRGKKIGSLLEALLPNRLVPAIAAAAEVDTNKRGYNLTKEERRALVRTLKEWRLGKVRSINIDRGEVTAGGVSLDEVNPQTMESRIVPGLFLCGELLDIAGPVGGYNLQAAFSSGYVAGESVTLIE